jgi:hypothetical protein
MVRNQLPTPWVKIGGMSDRQLLHVLARFEVKKGPEATWKGRPEDL